MRKYTIHYTMTDRKRSKESLDKNAKALRVMGAHEWFFDGTAREAEKAYLAAYPERTVERVYDIQ